jgi:hypothetical protein
MQFEEIHEVSCPVCRKMTENLKQMRLLSSVIAIPGAAVSHTVVRRSCPSCMRAYIWNKCLINGLCTLIVGYLVLVPYSLALTLVTLQKGHSSAVLHGITPEMELNAEGVYAPTRRQKRLATAAALMWLVPIFGSVFCQWVLWDTRWCVRGWVREVTEFASWASYLVTVVSIGLTIQYMWW